jgi:glycerophosphoryl diester phosphodiesterase
MKLIAGVAAMCAVVAVAQVIRPTLTGFAVLPADTFAAGPPSGAWLQANALGAPRFPSQPVQGISSLSPSAGPASSDSQARGVERWKALSDNGFGAKLNSADYLLRIYHLDVNWTAGAVRVVSHVQLADPDRRLPFPIVRSEGKERWLTGADVDPESFVAMPDGSFWIGDEFGPFLIHVGGDGRVLDRPYEIPNVRSPDHPHVGPPDAGQMSPAHVGRSRGFEGLTSRGDTLYAALEAGLLKDTGETRIYEFDLKARAFGNEPWRYRLEQVGNAVTEFVSLAYLGARCDTRFLAIERDGEHGPKAKFKRVYEVTLERNGPLVTKRLAADLLSIDNPKKLGGHESVFTFPFVTTEAVWAVTTNEIVLANDNNFPAGGGRPGAARDATEFIRVNLPTALCGSQ